MPRDLGAARGSVGVESFKCGGATGPHYPKLSDTTIGSTTTQSQSSLHKSATEGLPAQLLGYRVLVPPAADGTLSFKDHAGNPIVGHDEEVIDSSQACPMPVWFGNGEGIPCDNGFSVVLPDTTMKICGYWKPK